MEPQTAPRALEILIADDHEIFRDGVRELLEGHVGWRVCGEADSGGQAVAQAALLRPDVAIMDMYMPGLNGLDAARRIRATSPGTEVLLLTGVVSLQLLSDAMRCGVGAVALKTHPSSELVSAVQALERHERFVSKRLLREVGLADDRRSVEQIPAPVLTPREREVLQLLAEGKTNWCVASILDISVKTVETHRAKILDKLGLESSVDLVHYAIRSGYVDA